MLVTGGGRGSRTRSCCGWGLEGLGLGSEGWSGRGSWTMSGVWEGDRELGENDGRLLGLRLRWGVRVRG